MSDNKDNVESTRVSPNSKQTDKQYGLKTNGVIFDEFVGMDIPKGVTVNTGSDSKDVKPSVLVTDKSLSNNSTNNVNDNDNSDSDNDKSISKPKEYKNLKPFNTRPVEEQREIQRKGGKARAEQMKQRMTMKENLKLLLECKLSSQQSIEITDEFANLVGEDTSVQNVLMIQTLKQAMSGDTKAIALVRDTIGEKPIDESVVTSYTPTPEDMEMISNMRKRLGLEE